MPSEDTVTRDEDRRDAAEHHAPRKRDDGGPASPAFLPEGADSYFPGKSLRDWFAGQALVGNLANHECVWKEYPGDIAKDCYALADAMLAEREKGE